MMLLRANRSPDIDCTMGKFMSAPKILIIEDSPADLQLLQHGLNQQGEPYELVVLQDGEEALHFIDQQRSGAKTQPCVIVLDLHLPKHTGVEVLRALRQDPILTHVSVVVLTTLAAPMEEAEVRRIGAHFREKPMGLDEFTALAKFILDLCKSPSLARV